MNPRCGGAATKEGSEGEVGGVGGLKECKVAEREEGRGEGRIESG
jgi:hypothetical protein